MTAATRGRSKAVNVNKQSVEQAGSYLQELPEKPKENLSLREAVGQLRDQIQAALAKGYSYDDLAKMLTEKGIEISATTLKSYVPAGKRQSNKDKATTGKTRTRRTRKTDDPEPAEQEPAAETVIADAPEETPEKKPTRRRTRTAAASAKEGRSSRATANKPATRSTRGRQKRS
jgi:septum formation inhibitor MinC